MESRFKRMEVRDSVALSTHCCTTLNQHYVETREKEQRRHPRITSPNNASMDLDYAVVPPKNLGKGRPLKPQPQKEKVAAQPRTRKQKLKALRIAEGFSARHMVSTIKKLNNLEDKVSKKRKDTHGQMVDKELEKIVPDNGVSRSRVT